VAYSHKLGGPSVRRCPIGALVAANVTKSHGPTLVLDGVSLVVAAGARIGLVGPNGIGKSTLLRILAGLEPPDSGRVRRDPPALAVGYLPQEPDVRPGETLLDFLARRTGVAAAEARLAEAERVLALDPARADAHAEALERFLALGGADLEARAAAACADVGLPTTLLDRALDALSGGETARAKLAAILLARYDVFLLDEPTNDLDFGGLALLEGFLAGLEGAVAVVSHDRDFLDRAVTRVVELEEGTRRAVEYAGGWSAYEAERARARRRHYDAYDSYEGERERLEGQFRRMQEWERRGYGQGRKKKKSKDVRRSFEGRIARLARVEKPFEPWELHLRLAPEGRVGDVVARLEGAVVERGGFRLGPLDLELRRGDRLAVLGANGSGKTSLLQALLGRLPLAAGRATLGQGVVPGELEQARGTFAGGALLPAFAGATGLAPEESRTLLAKFGLGADDVLRAGASLSPGERSRAGLAALVARGVNLLVLDEPTNHLDVPAIEELESALAGYRGTVVLVTHDRRFLERFGATRTLELPPSRARAVPAGPTRPAGRRDRAPRATSS
jgi:ATPase subunit of ABC transporter with duplicated ATPase domains